MLNRIVLSLLIALAGPALPCHAAAPTFKVADRRLIMDNGFVHLEFNERHASIDVAKADFSGQGHYGDNLLATNPLTGAGIVLETVDSNGKVHRSTDARSSIAYKILKLDSHELMIRIEGIRDQKYRPETASIWTLTLPADSRDFGFVPMSNVMGRPLFVYWSYDASARHTRWDRTLMPMLSARK